MRTAICLDDLELSGQIRLPALRTEGAVQPAERLRWRMVADGPVKVLQVMPERDGALPQEPSEPGASSSTSTRNAEDDRVVRGGLLHSTFTRWLGEVGALNLP